MIAYVTDRSGIERRFSPANVRVETAVNAGFTVADVELPGRAEGVQVLNSVEVRDSQNRIAWEGRVEAIPHRDGRDTIECVGHSALFTGEPFRFLGVDSDPQSWSEPPKAQVLTIEGANQPLDAHFTASAEEDVLKFESTTDATVVSGSQAQLWYQLPLSEKVAEFQYLGRERNIVNVEAARLYQTDDPALEAGSMTFDALTLDSTLRSVTVDPVARYLMLRMAKNDATAFGANPRKFIFEQIAEFGDHDLPRVNVPGQSVQGLLASDIVRHLIARQASPIATSAGGVETIAPTSFALSQAAWVQDPVTLRDVLDELTSYEDRDWFVYEGPVFHWQPRGSLGRTWRLSFDALPEDQGPQAEDAYNGVVVSYERGGQTLTVGPPGSGADFEDASLADDDPNNPVNASPTLDRRYLAVELGVATRDEAIRIGQKALADVLRRKVRGTVAVPPTCKTAEGIKLPSHLIRSGDRVVFGTDVDSPEGYVIATSYDTSQGDRPMTLTLDNPSNAIGAAAARLAHPRRRLRSRRRSAHHTFRSSGFSHSGRRG